ncbi:MAG TPA: hypothetical protein DCX27_15020 [Balneola sp.]|jgi:hypothetical protein|nr:hypothetical protein [Balneola sp.]|tara:strand:+ start:600 stop:872 length:273 start_codon:yes stop_codon:yes gene_type:complete
MRSKIPKCSAECILNNTVCEKKDCRDWIDYKKEHNCSKISIYLHGRMTLKQIAERLGISIPRVKQIETKALMRLKSILANNNDSLGVYDW